MQTTEGVVLYALQQKERDQLLTLFTPQGFLKLYVKGRSPRQGSSLVYAPFALGEFLYHPSKGSIHKVERAELLFYNHHLHDSLESLEAALILAKALLSSQYPGKAAFELYALFRYFLPQLHLSPHNIKSAFLLKLMAHEGLLHEGESCSLCDSLPTHYRGGECFCALHSPEEAVGVDEEERLWMRLLLKNRSFATLKGLSIPDLLHQKVEKLLWQAL